MSRGDELMLVIGGWKEHTENYTICPFLANLRNVTLFSKDL